MRKVANAMKESKASPVHLISLPYWTLSVTRYFAPKYSGTSIYNEPLYNEVLRMTNDYWGHSFCLLLGAGPTVLRHWSNAGKGQYLYCLVVLSISTVRVIKAATFRSTVKCSWLTISHGEKQAKQPRKVQYIGWNLSKRVPLFTSKISCSRLSPLHLKNFLQKVR